MLRSALVSRALVPRTFGAPLIIKPRYASTFTLQETTAAEVKKSQKPHPTSPHLTIYKLPLPAIMSITHRVTGGALSVGVSAVAIGMLQASHELTYYISALNASPVGGPIAKFVVSFPLIYHTLAGVRHLVWDQGKFITLDKVYLSGYAIIGASLLGSIGLALISF
jgi:succinate dehydrogenase (ubiquinone) cytochrome b560 subunit